MPNSAQESAPGLILITRGHARPQLYLAFNLLELFPSLHITFLVAPVFAPNIPKETDLFGPSEDVKSRIRIITLGKSGLRQSDWEPQYLTLIEDLRSGLLFLPLKTTSNEPGPEFFKRQTLTVIDVFDPRIQEPRPIS